MGHKHNNNGKEDRSNKPNSAPRRDANGHFTRKDRDACNGKDCYSKHSSADVRKDFSDKTDSELLVDVLDFLIDTLENVYVTANCIATDIKVVRDRQHAEMIRREENRRFRYSLLIRFFGGLVVGAVGMGIAILAKSHFGW